jgi:hypothetical protein
VPFHKAISVLLCLIGLKAVHVKRAARKQIALERLDLSFSSFPSSLLSSLFLVPFLLLSGIFLSTSLQAQEVIISPNDGELGINRSVALFNGSLLPTNSLIRIGTFASGGTNASELSAFVNSWTNQTSTTNFLSFLNTNFVSWNSFGSANSPWPGADSVTVTNTNTPAFAVSNLVGKPMYLWAFSTPTNDSSAEMLILRSWLPEGFPDPEGGLNSLFSLLPSGTNGVTYLDPDENEVTEYGVSVLFGQYFSDSLQFRMSGVNPSNEITSPLTETNASGAVSNYQITANNGADRFFATTNTANADLTLTTLPTGFSIATNTGVITAGTNAAANTYSIRLVASNSLTASVATNTLTWTLQASSLSFTTTTNLISAVAGVEISPFTFVSTGTSPTYTADGNLRGLILSTNGLLSGIPSSVGTNDVTITSSAGGQNGTTTFSLAVAAPTISVPAGELTGGQIVHTAGTARTVTLSKSAGFTDLTGLVSPTTSGVTFNGTDLVIAADAVPLLKGLNNINLTLTASKVGVSGASASTTVPLRIVAPTPTRLVGPSEFEVDVGQAFSTTILSDAGAYGRMSFSNLPSGLLGNQNGVVAGTNNSTNLPYEFAVRVEADSTQIYEGGGTYTNTNVIFRLRNTNAPYFGSATNRYIAGVGRAISDIPLDASNYPFLYTASNLPTGLSLSGNTISGTPTVAGVKYAYIEAYNSLRPGSTNPADWRSGRATLIFHIAGAKPSGSALPSSPGAIPRNSTISLNDNVYLIPGGAENQGVRIAAYGLPPGISVDRTTGKLYGTTGQTGTYTATVFVQNGRGWIEKTVTLTVQ